MTAAQLRLLRVLGFQLVANGIQELDIALLGILLQGRDESPGHGARSLPCDLGVLSSWRRQIRLSFLKMKSTYEVCVSLEPDHITTSAGDVLVWRAFSYPASPLVAFLKKPIAVLAIPDMSPLA